MRLTFYRPVCEERAVIFLTCRKEFTRIYKLQKNYKLQKITNN